MNSIILFFNFKIISSHKPVFPILKIVEKYLNVIPKGNGHWCVCPFHNDNNPSLSISVEKNIWRCFSCNAAGDAIGFVMKIEKCEYKDAILKIGSILNIDVSSYLSFQDHKKQSLYKLNEYVAEMYHKHLFNNTFESKKALNYLLIERKLTKQSIEKYKIGFSPYENFLEKIIQVYVQQNKVSEETIEESNLFLNDSHMNRRSFFRNRIMFPIWNENNKVIGFCGRGENPKYLNLKNNLVFSKTNAIFGINHLKINAPIYLFEGFLDLIKTEQALGAVNGVACMGGSLMESSILILKEYSRKFVICFDNDDPGRSFVFESGKKLISMGCEVNVVDFFEYKYKDIDEMMDHDVQNGQKILENPIGFFRWFHRWKTPKDLDETKLLAEDCLGIFVDKNGRLKSNISLKYAKTLIEEIFDWYLETPESKEFDLARKINDQRKKYLGMIHERAIEETNKKLNLRNVNNEFIFNDFVKLAIKYQNLAQFIHSAQFQEWNGYRRFEWEYIMDQEFKLNHEEIQWMFKHLEMKECSTKKPEVLTMNQQKAVNINSQGDFFNKYYSFYHEYLDKLSSFYVKNEFLSVETKMQKIFRIKSEISNLEKISSKFFLNSDFYSKK